MEAGIQRVGFCLTLIMGAAFLFGCSGPEEASSPTPEYTYWGEVEPIIEAKCATCHGDDGIGYLPLDNYRAVHEHRHLIKSSIVEERMPPWPPASDCREYRHDRSLTDRQRDVILTWIEEDAPEGDPAEPGDPIATDGVELPKVDATLTMEEPYQPPLSAEMPDEYRCFLLDWPFEDRKYVTGFQVDPGNKSIVHHAEAHIALPQHLDEYEQLVAADEGPGYSCFGGVLGPEGGAIGGWVPGHPGLLFPAQSGVRVEPGSKIVLQVHYHGFDGGEWDQTSFDVVVEDTVEREGFFMPWVNPLWVDGEMPIPAGDSDVVHRFRWEATSSLSSLLPFEVTSFDIWSAQLHMHYLGTRASLSLYRDGEEQCLLHIPEWDRDWQADYFFEDPVRVEEGDELSIECRWDNSTENQPLINGDRPTPTDVNWGWGSRDEMCVGFFYVTL